MYKTLNVLYYLMDAETRTGKSSLLIYKLIERMVRVGITSSFMGKIQMVADYITMKQNENQKVFDSNPSSYVMKIVEIFKHNPQLRHHDIKTTIKKVGEYFSYYEEIENRKEITEILEVIAFIDYKTSCLTYFIFQDMKDIQDVINNLVKDKHTKPKLKNIIKFLATYYPSEKLEKYKSVIIEYVNQKNIESEVNK